MDYKGFFASALNKLRDERRYRVFADLERIAGRFPHAIWHSPQGKRDVVIWCSNDYLGMAQHPKVIGAMVEAAARMGTGAGGTRNIAGTNHPLVELERELADLHDKAAALVFTSGYVSNETGIATIAKLLPNCLLLSDALNHNSMIEGVRQSGCEKKIWRHNDLGHLEELLKAADSARPKLIVFEVDDKTAARTLSTPNLAWWAIQHLAASAGLSARRSTQGGSRLLRSARAIDIGPRSSRPRGLALAAAPTLAQNPFQMALTTPNTQLGTATLER
jgi:hypothetical protein